MNSELDYRYITSYTNDSIGQVETLLKRYHFFVNFIVLYFPTYIPYLQLADQLHAKMGDIYNLRNMLSTDLNQFKIKTRFANYKPNEHYSLDNRFFVSAIKKVNKENKVMAVRELESYMPAVKSAFVHLIDCTHYLFFAKNMHATDLIYNKKIKSNIFFISLFLDYCEKITELIQQK